ncbi:hypothetical protein Sfulv_61660 [Streptomyces fulvorobeus]|uniref:Pycsar effector protein domain-containing protein n=1 Tax=Streptomyces fulvorobeus TaxID=284028 RepID=A0A7J0CFU9_9ACTN|nr:hypothetical protein Sfulv_61660 [Streptomyces fulvorobeus]
MGIAVGAVFGAGEADVVGASCPEWMMQPGRRQWVRECASYAFTEVQRADVKATVLCGVAGALLGVGVVCLTDAGGVPWVLACSLTVACVLLGLSVGVSLWAIRPVIPAGGFQRELAGCGGVRGLGQFVAAVGREGAVEEQWWEVRRLWVLSALAGRKLMWVRLGVDLVIAALVVAGLGVLITYVLG